MQAFVHCLATGAVECGAEVRLGDGRLAEILKSEDAMQVKLQAAVDTAL